MAEYRNEEYSYLVKLFDRLAAIGRTMQRKAILPKTGEAEEMSMVVDESFENLDTSQEDTHTCTQHLQQTTP